MNIKKYELTDNFIMIGSRKLYQIRALIDIEKCGIKAGDLGGYIESEKNLSHTDNAWVYDNAWVCGNAWVCDDAKVCGKAKVCDNAWVYGNAKVCGNAWVCDDAKVCGKAKVYGNAKVCGNAWVCDDADILYIAGLGTVHRSTTVFKCKDDVIRIKCGCFYGNIEEFKTQVINTRDGKAKEEYLKFAELVEIYFGVDKSEVKSDE